jgi:hypothetical protein
VANISSSLTSYVYGLLTSDTGLNSVLQAYRQAEGTDRPDDVSFFSVQNTSPEIIERSTQTHYPAVLAYCDKLSNSLKEKFRTFSGNCRMVIEVRCSQDRLQGLERTLEQYTDAVCAVLDGARGDWQDGAFYTGGYDITYGAVRHGGKNFLQTAKVSFEVEISR